MSEAASQETVFDVGRQQVAAVYAKALLEAAEKTGTGDSVAAELGVLVREGLDRLPQLAAILASPQVSVEEKGALLEKAFAGRVSPQLLIFLKVLARRGRLDCLRAVERQYGELLRERRGRTRVLVTTAAAVEPAVLEAVGERLSGMLGRPVDLEHRIDPAVIGGLVVRVGDRLYDGSVRRQLQKLGRESLAAVGRDMRSALERFVAG